MIAVMIRSAKFPPALAGLAYIVIAGCLAPTPWWEKDLRTWVGADDQELESVWGPPVRTIVGKSGNPVMVYESHTTINLREETLRDPSKMVSEQPPAPGPQVEDYDCQMFFEVQDEKIVNAWYEGAGCQVIPRPTRSPGS